MDILSPHIKVLDDDRRKMVNINNNIVNSKGKF